MQTTSQPRVRSACEPCHERKQRCIIPEAGGPCQSCQQSSRNCFFIPRFKAGRPRRNDGATDSVTCSNPTEPSPSPLQQSPLLSSSANLQHCTDYFSAEHVVGQAPAFTEPLDAVVGMENIESYDGMNQLDMMFSSSSSDTSMGVPNMLDFNLPPATVPDAVLTLTERYAEMHRNELLLRQCGASTPTPLGSRSHLLPSFISSIEFACANALTLSRTNPTTRDQDLAISALLLATMLKVIMLSEAILLTIEAQSNDAQPEHNNHGTRKGGVDLESALVFTQLDMSLAQAKHCLYQLGRQQHGTFGAFATAETLQKTRELHTKIGKLMDKVNETQWS